MSGTSNRSAGAESKDAYTAPPRVRSPNPIHHRDAESTELGVFINQLLTRRPLRLCGESSPIFFCCLATYVRRHFLDERIFVDGFGDVAGAAGGQRFLAVALHCIGSDGDYRDIGRRRLLFELLSDFKPVHSGQLNVHDNEIRPFLLNHLERGRRRGRLPHLVAVRTQQEPGEPPIHLIVLNQQNFLFVHKDFSRQGAKTLSFHHRDTEFTWFDKLTMSGLFESLILKPVERCVLSASAVKLRFSLARFRLLNPKSKIENPKLARRQREIKPAPFADFAIEPDSAAVHLDKFLR